jgi:hypothetical protein
MHYYYTWFERLIDEGVAKGEIDVRAKMLAKGFFAAAKGMFVFAETTYAVENIEAELTRFIDTMVDVLTPQKKDENV